MVTSAGAGKAAPSPPTVIKARLSDWLGCYLLPPPLLNLCRVRSGTTGIAGEPLPLPAFTPRQQPIEGDDPTGGQTCPCQRLGVWSDRDCSASPTIDWQKVVVPVGGSGGWMKDGG